MVQNAQKQNSIRKQGYKCVAVVTAACVWVRMDAYRCVSVGEHMKQADKDAHGSNTHDFPATVAGKFPKINTWVRG